MRLPPLSWLTVLAALTLAPPGQGFQDAAARQDPALFQSVPADSIIPPPSGDAAAIRERNVIIPLELLGLDDQAVGAPVDRVVLNLFDDLAWTGVYESAESAYDDGVIVRYGIEEDPHGYAVFSIVGQSIAATVRADDVLYKVVCVAPGQEVVREIDEIRQPWCGTADAPGVGQIVPPQLPPSPGYQYIQDLLCVYTTAAKLANGGDDGMVALINLAVYETNMGYSQSDVMARCNLVHVEELVYTENGNEVDLLNDMQDPGDGVVDEIHTLRDDYGADMVMAIYDTGFYCGVAYDILCTVGDTAFESSAFCVVKDSCATGNYSFGHELGHLQGAHHEYAGGSSCEIVPWCYAYRTPSQAYRTIMCYAPGTRLDFWSNANKLAPSGEALGAVGSEENYDALNQSATTVSAWRSYKAYGHDLITQFNSDNGFAGNMFDIRPKTDIEIYGMDINTSAAVGDMVTVDPWYRQGSYVGYEGSSAGWIKLASGSGTSAGQDNSTHISLYNYHTFSAGQDYGLYLDLTSYSAGVQSLRYTNGAPTTYEDGFLKLTTGVGKGVGFGGSTFLDRQWNGRIHYRGATAAQSLSTGFAGSNQFAGNMFDVYAKKDLTINSFDVNVDTSANPGLFTADVWMKTGSYAGYESDPYSWTFVGTDYKAYGYGAGSPSRIAVGNIDLQGGQMYAFYIHLASYNTGHSLKYTTGGSDVENSDLKIYVGCGRGDDAFSGSVFTNRMWNGTIRYSLGPWWDLGYGLGGRYGVPSLIGKGTLLPGDGMSLILTNAAPYSQCALVIGTGTWYAKFSGGVMVPSIDMLKFFKASALGNVTVSANWPMAMPQGMPVYFQYWIFDKSGPKGFTASNGLQATTQ